MSTKSNRVIVRELLELSTVQSFKFVLSLDHRLTHRRNRAPVPRTQREAPGDSSEDDDGDDILIAFDGPRVPVPLPAVQPGA